jgi:tRNA-Thr(GGU) m(6)t(6)A37 methyltransferase TsaA
MQEMEFIKVGEVRSPFERPTLEHRGGDLVRGGEFEDPWGFESKIVIDPFYEDALDGIEGFSHILVIFKTRRLGSEDPRKVHPAGQKDIERQGIFATRSPVRPNPIAITTVQLIGREGNVLKVKGLDAINGSIVLDIKPHMPSYDAPADAHLSGWMMEMRERFGW